MKPKSTSKPAFLKQIANSPILLSFIFFFYVLLKHKRDMRLTYLLTVFIFLQIHLDLPFRRKTYMKIRAFYKIQFLR